jgi:thioredoxin 1
MNPMSAIGTGSAAIAERPPTERPGRMGESDGAQPARAAPSLTLICLCAEWCGSCRDFAATFEALRATHPTTHFHWIDIEDQPDLVGDLDITSFPTLVLASDAGLHFAGPVVPQLPIVARLLDAAHAGTLAGDMPPALRRDYQRVVAAAAAGDPPTENRR